MASSIQKFIKNVSGSEQTIEGQLIADGAYYLIQATEEVIFASSSALLGLVAAGTVLMSRTDDGLSDITDINEGIDFLKQLIPAELIISSTQSDTLVSLMREQVIRDTVLQERTMDQLISLGKQLEKLNKYFALITNTRL